MDKQPNQDINTGYPAKNFDKKNDVDDLNQHPHPGTVDPKAKFPQETNAVSKAQPSGKEDARSFDDSADRH